MGRVWFAVRVGICGLIVGSKWNVFTVLNLLQLIITDHIL